MPHNYYDATGVLILDQVTPVIAALFGGFALDATHVDQGEVSITRLSSLHDPQWSEINDSLCALASRLGVVLDEVRAGDQPTLPSCLRQLAVYFHVAQDLTLGRLIATHAFDGSADVETLFAIASRFDDGHGLKAIKFEGAWHSGKPRPFPFGGEGLYISREVTMCTHSTQARELGQYLHAALLAGNLDQAASRLAVEVFGLLAGIGDRTIRDALRLQLANRLLDGNIAPTA